MSGGTTALFVLGLIFIQAVLSLYRNGQKRKLANPKDLPLPPGPQALPIIGNIRHMPTSFEWLTYSEWAKQYGDVIHIKAFGNHIIVLNTLQAATDIFEKRASIYSDRPRMPMINELMGFDWAFSAMSYGPWWRRHRKAFHQHFNQSASNAYFSSQTLEARKMLKQLLKTPENFLYHIRHTGVATTMRVAYGIEVHDSDDPYIGLAEAVASSVAEAGLPGAFLVNILPCLKYVPAWLPGAGFKKKALYWRKIARELFDKPYQFSESAIASGTALPSVAASLLENIKYSTNYAEEEQIARSIAAIANGAGTDTSISAIQVFFLAMLLYPEVQKKAQVELDAVIGRSRLPEFSDRPALPYVEAIVKETFRWQPVLPLGFPHCAASDGEYNGYYIPKGTTIIGNIWSILHNESIFPEPHVYRPERFLKDRRSNTGIRDFDAAAFGFGRRICPGRHMAMNGAFITIASVLAAFDITPTSDSPTKAEMSSSFISYPEPFKCNITPRSGDVSPLIRQSLEADEVQR